MTQELNGHLAWEIFNAMQSKNFPRWWHDNAPRDVEISQLRELEILPLPREKSLGILEIMGESGGGKTAGLDYLQNHPIEKTRTIIRPELVIEDPRGSSTDYNLHELKTFMRILYGNADRMTYWNLIKLMSFVQGLGQIGSLIKQDALDRTNGPPIKMIIERGPNDVISTSSLSVSDGLVVDSKYEINDLDEDGVFSRPDFDNLLLYTFFGGLAQAEWVDSVVLYYVSTKKRKERRVKDGKTEQGGFINDDTDLVIRDGYVFWFNFIYPLLRKRYGTGLLVINGDNPLEKNNEKLRNFT